MTEKQVRCIHRHLPTDHPVCFSEGLVVDKREDAKLPWWQEEGTKIGYLDIETDGLKADFSTMLTWCLKEKDGGVVYDIVSKDELFHGSTDQRIVKSLVDEMNKYRIIVGYYSTGFDVPYLRSKALHYGLEFPSYADIYHFDLYYTVKSKLKLSRNSLDAACDYLGIKGKTPIDREVWRQAKYGDAPALRQVLAHNVGDVEILEELHNKLAFTAKWTKRSI